MFTISNCKPCLLTINAQLIAIAKARKKNPTEALNQSTISSEQSDVLRVLVESMTAIKQRRKK